MILPLDFKDWECWEFKGQRLDCLPNALQFPVLSDSTKSKGIRKGNICALLDPDKEIYFNCSKYLLLISAQMILNVPAFIFTYKVKPKALLLGFLFLPKPSTLSRGKGMQLQLPHFMLSWWTGFYCHCKQRPRPRTLKLEATGRFLCEAHYFKKYFGGQLT